MRRFSKALSLVLTLAIVLSVFGMFSAFVSAADTQPTGVTTMYDMDSRSSISVINYYTSYSESTGKYSGSLPLTKMEDANGQRYWVESPRGSIRNGGDYFSMLSNSTRSAVIQASTDDTTSAGDDVKDTKYLVYDMDLSTDSMYPTKVYWNQRFTYGGSTAYNDLNATSAEISANNFQINFQGTEVLSISDAAGNNPVYNLALNGEKWTHVTVIYDLSGATNADYKVYAYINGVYCGTVIDGMTDTLCSMWFSRIQTGMAVDSTQSINYANMTLKKFGMDYTGDLSMLANEDVKLGDIADLAYTMEDVPAETKLAEIKRGTETIEVTDFDQLDASLQDGDEVTLYANLNRKVLVQKGDNITWNVGDYSKAEPIEYENLYDYDWIIRDFEGAVISEGAGNQVYNTETAVDDEGNLTLTTDALTTKIGATPAASRVITLLSERVVTKPNGIKPGAGVSLVFDLNGNTLVHNTDGNIKLFTLSSNGRVNITIKNGTYEYDQDGGNFAMPNGYTGISVIFKNLDKLDMSQGAGTVFDQRAGVVVFKDCKEFNSGTCTLSNIKSIKSGLRHSRLVVDGCTITANKDGLFSLSGVNSSSSGCDGPCNLGLTIKNSTITNTGKVVNLTTLAYNKGTLSDEGVFTPSNDTLDKNQSKVFIDIVNSTLTQSGGSALIQTDIGDVPITTVYAGGKKTLSSAYWPAGMELDVDISISDNSHIQAYNLVRQAAGPSLTGAPEDFVFSYDVDVDVDGTSTIKTINGGGIVLKNDATSTANISFADGAKISTKEIYDTGSSAYDAGTVTYGANGEGVLAHTSIYDGFPYIVREVNNCDKYSYRAGEYAKRYFYWNNEEGEVVDPWIAGRTEIGEKPTDTANYKNYCWVLKDEPDSADLKGSYITTFDAAFNPSLNLTLNRDISLNLLLPSTIDPAKVVVSAVNANEETVAVYAFDGVVTVDGVDYYKYQIRNVTPNMADEIYTYQVAITGAYKETITKELGVSPVKYAQDMLALDTTAEDAELVALLNALLNYFEAAYAYGGVEKNFTDVAAGEAVYGTLPENGENTVIETYQLNLKSSFTWIITLKEGVTNAKVTYNSYGEAKTVDVVDGKAYISLKACDLLDNVTVTADQGTYALNFATYITELGDVDDKTDALLVAMSVYADAARAYQN